ncbi:MAG: NAD(P)H-quinone oxidoreductase [Pseudomonadota bacterium]
MQAVTVDGERLSWGTVARPELGAGEVRIRVRATAANRADLAQRAGAYPPPPGASPILGLECAGEVTEVGDGVQRFRVGDAVCALLAGGGYAEEVVVAAGQALPIPRGLSLVEAAALPEVFATAYLNLYMEAELRRGDRMLIHAGASGVGTAAIQLGVVFDNPSFVTVGSQAKLDACLALGADAGHLRTNGDFVDAVTSWHGGGGIDVVLDPVGANYLASNLKVLGLDGRLVVIGLMGGVTAELNLGALMMKRLRVIGSTLRARPIPAKAAVMDALYDEVWPHIEAGRIRPIVDRVAPIAEVEAVHRAMAEDENVGKLVMELPA